MKYISLPNDEYLFDHDRYLVYLNSVRASLPEHVYAFAANTEYFTLNSPHSLHDSWLNSVEVKESRQKERPFDPVVNVTLKLFGQLHDRIIVLEYEDVSRYQLEGKRNPWNWADTFHGDVLTHEVRLGEGGALIREILYRSDSTLFIECKNFTHREELLEQSS